LSFAFAIAPRLVSAGAGNDSGQKTPLESNPLKIQFPWRHRGYAAREPKLVFRHGRKTRDDNLDALDAQLGDEVGGGLRVGHDHIDMGKVAEKKRGATPEKPLPDPITLKIQSPISNTPDHNMNHIGRAGNQVTSVM